MIKDHYEIFDDAFEIPGEKIGCLLIHGFTGAPSELKPLGEYLALKGIGIHSIRLAGHGTKPEDMANTRWPDWYNSAKQGLLHLKGKYDQIFVVGLSMGGLLALKLAAEFKVDGVISINAPIYLKNRAIRLVPLLQFFKKYHQKPKIGSFRNRFAYDRVPLKALASLLQLITHTKKQVLKKVCCPVLVVQSKDDETVLPKSGEYIFRNLAEQKKQLLWLSEAGHIATLGKAQEELFIQISNFLCDNKE